MLTQLNVIHIVGAITVPILNKRATLSLSPGLRGLAVMNSVFIFKVKDLVSKFWLINKDLCQ